MVCKNTKRRILQIILMVFCSILNWLPVMASSGIDGIWIGTLDTEKLAGEEFPFFDIFYTEEDALYLRGAFGCESDNGFLEFKKVAANKYSLTDPVDCNPFNINMWFKDFTLTFFNNSVNIDVLVFAEQEKIYINGIGHQLTDINRWNFNQQKSISGAEESFEIFSIDIPAGIEELEITTSGGQGDCDLELVYFKPPFYYASSEDDYTTEKIKVTDPAPGMWYIIVYGFENYNNVVLQTHIHFEDVVNPWIDLHINGSANSITVNPTDNIRLTLSLDPGSYNNNEVDWWFALSTPSGLKYYDLNTGTFKFGLTCTYQGPLFKIYNFDLIQKMNLSEGRNVIYFGIDLIKNGVLDLNSLFYDYIEISVSP